MFRTPLAGLLVVALVVASQLGTTSGVSHGTVVQHLNQSEMVEITGSGTGSVLIGVTAFSLGLTAAVVGIAILSGGVATPAIAAIYIGMTVGGVSTSAAGWGAIWCGMGRC